MQWDIFTTLYDLVAMPLLGGVDAMIGSLPPWPFLEAAGVRAVHYLRVVGQGLLLRHVAPGRAARGLGGVRPRGRALRDRRLRCAIRSLCTSRERRDGNKQCSQNNER